MYELTGDTRYRDIAEYFLEEVLTERCLRHRQHQRRRVLAQRSRRSQGHAAISRRRVLRCLQPDEAGAPHLRLVRRRALDGRLRAPAVELPPGHAERAGPEAILLPARRRLLALLQLGGRFLLVLHRNRRGRVRKVQRHDLLPRLATASGSTSSSPPNSIGRSRTSASARTLPSQPSREPPSASKPPRPQRRTIHIRIPAWIADGGSVRINGRELEAFAQPGSYLSLTREWRDGDKIEVALPMQLRTEPLLGDPTLRAAFYGPLLLAADLGPGPDRSPPSASAATTPAPKPPTSPSPRPTPSHPRLPRPIGST